MAEDVLWWDFAVNDDTVGRSCSGLGFLSGDEGGVISSRNGEPSSSSSTSMGAVKDNAAGGARAGLDKFAPCCSSDRWRPLDGERTGERGGATAAACPCPCTSSVAAERMAVGRATSPPAVLLRCLIRSSIYGKEKSARDGEQWQQHHKNNEKLARAVTCGLYGTQRSGTVTCGLYSTVRRGGCQFASMGVGGCQFASMGGSEGGH